MNKFLLSLSTVLFLAACGGGGSDNNAAADPPSSNDQDKIPTPQPATGSIQGYAYALSTRSTLSGAGIAHTTAGNTLASINVNGKTVALQIPGFSAGGFTILRGTTVNGKSYSTFVVSGNRYAHSKFGYVNDGDDFVFSHGTPTAAMPATGRVEYGGEAVVGQNGNVTIADADFVADFGAKTLQGSISHDSSRSTYAFNPIAINASITDNHFASADNAAVSSRGRFYGDNAAELGGIFYDRSQEISGSFGAHKGN